MLRQSVVFAAEASAGGRCLECTERLHTAATCSRKPNFRAICSALSARIANVPEPTLPKPTMPMLTASIVPYDTKWHSVHVMNAGIGQPGRFARNRFARTPALHIAQHPARSPGAIGLTGTLRGGGRRIKDVTPKGTCQIKARAVVAKQR